MPISVHSILPKIVHAKLLITLAEKLINKGLKKTEIAYQIANAIDEDLTKYEKGEIAVKTIQIPTDDENDTVNYLVKAIRYAAGN